jgi:two-component system nitrate/nitrite response regulator NarL
VLRVFILAAVRLYREGLQRSLTDTPSMTVVGCEACPADALRLIPVLCPDVVLLDVGMAEGVRVAREIRAATSRTRVIALAVSETATDVIACAEAGMSGYVTQDGTVSDLIATIERAARGETLCPPNVTASLFDRLAALSEGRFPTLAAAAPELTAREVEVLLLIERGLSNKEIARTLSIALPTVKNHVHNLLRKLQVNCRAEATSYLPLLQSAQE